MYPVISWTIGSSGKHGKGTHKMDFGQMPAHKHCCTLLLSRSVRSHPCSVQQVPVYWLSSAFGVTASSATTGSLPMPRDGLAGHCRISCADQGGAVGAADGVRADQILDAEAMGGEPGGKGAESTCH